MVIWTFHLFLFTFYIYFKSLILLFTNGVEKEGKQDIHFQNRGLKPQD
jgi:hypothetical protein